MAQGHTRIGRYELIGLAGNGAMATVFGACQPDLDREVALKHLSLQLLAYNGASPG